jgi:hypothetical protein
MRQNYSKSAFPGNVYFIGIRCGRSESTPRNKKRQRSCRTQKHFSLIDIIIETVGAIKGKFPFRAMVPGQGPEGISGERNGSPTIAWICVYHAS